MKKPLEVVERKELSAESLIQQGIDKGLPVESLEKLLAMRRELRAEFAKSEFDTAMAEFQMECPTIEKTKEVMNNGKLLYKYAPIESIVQQVKNLLNKHDFSYAIQTATLEERVKVTCIVKHSAGHSESSDIEIPLGTKTGIMSASQQVAAALTFAKRYAFCNAFGILTGDEDTDAAPEKPPERHFAPSKPIQKVLTPQETIVRLVTEINGSKLETKEEYEHFVKENTGLELVPDNFEAIIERLTVFVPSK